MHKENKLQKRPEPIGHHSNGMPIWAPGATSELGKLAGQRLILIFQKGPDDPNTDPFHLHRKRQQTTA